MLIHSGREAVAPRPRGRRAATAVTRVEVRTASLASPIKALSGGNQQKALIARWLLARPTVAIIRRTDPRVNVGAKASIYEIIEAVVAEGLGALVTSSELGELIRLCDRVLAVYEGRVVGEVVSDEVTSQTLGRLALGA